MPFLRLQFVFLVLWPCLAVDAACVVDCSDLSSATTTYDDATRTRTRIDTDESGRTTVADTRGRTVEVRKPLSVTESTVYNLAGNPIRSEDANGNATTFVYDDAHRLTEQHKPLVKTTTYTRDGNGQVLTETTTGGTLTRTTTRQYNHPLGLVTKEDRGEGVIVRGEYDGNGNLLKQIDPRGNPTTQVFDARNRLTQRIEPNGRTSSWTFDAADRKTAEIHSSGWRRDYTYNALGQLTVERDALGKTTLRTYNKRGDILSTTDRTGAVVTAQYDSRSRKTRQDGPVPGKGWNFQYDKANNLIIEYRNPAYDPNAPDSVLNADQNFTYSYDALNRRTQTADQLGTIESLTYDANGNVLTQTDGNGHQTSFDYNALNQKTRQTAPESRITSWAYSVWGEPLTETQPEGGTTTHQYDATGRKVRTTHPLIDGQTEAAFETWDYDAAGNVIAHRDGNGHATTFGYDNGNRKTSQTDPAPLSFQQIWTFDSEGNLRRHIDRNQIATEYGYDAENRKITTTRDNLLREQLDYDGEGRIAARTDAQRHTTRYVMDAAGRVIRATTPEGIVREQTYTPSGDVRTSDNGEGQISRYDYDPRRRKIAETNPNNETTRLVYDNAGNLRRQFAAKFNGEIPALGIGCSAPTEANHYATTFCYDNANRLTQVIDANGVPTHYDYDRNDNLVAVIEPGNKRSEFQYDARNRRTQKKSPDLATGPPQIWTWSYDGNSLPVSHSDPLGVVFTSSYDELDRKRQTVITNGTPGSPTLQTWQYDANGNVTALAETNGAQTPTLTFLYDAFNRPYQITDANGRQWRQTFKPNDQRESLDSANIPRVTWNYDADNRPTEIVVDGAGTFELSYDKADRNKTITHPNGVITTHQFDAASRIAEIDHARGGGTIAKFQYRYDANGNRIEQIEQNGGSAGTTTFEYDPADRLSAISEPGKYTAYTLDSNGNRIETKEGPAIGQTTRRWSSTFDARNQIVEQQEYSGTGALLGSTDFDFDAKGNLIQQTRGAAQTQWRYDALDRLIETTPPTGPPTQYRYGPGDVRIATIRAGMETRYHYDGERLILETNVLDNPQKHYVYSAAGLLGTTILSGTPQYRFAHLDAQTSPIAITATNGNILNRSHFDAYGVETSLHGTRDQAISFQGYWSGVELDEAGSLLSAARLYLPGLGIFGERDPVEGQANAPATFNPYIFGRNNPHYWFDPDGRCGEAMMDMSDCADLVAYVTGDNSIVEVQRRATDQASAMGVGLLYGMGSDVVTGVIEGVQWAADTITTPAEMALGTLSGGAIQLGGIDRNEVRANQFAAGVERLVFDPWSTLAAPSRHSQELQHQGRYFEAGAALSPYAGIAAGGVAATRGLASRLGRRLDAVAPDSVGVGGLIDGELNAPSGPLSSALPGRSSHAVVLEAGTDGPVATASLTVPSIRDGAFRDWFDRTSAEEFNQYWADPKLRGAIQSRLRSPGKLHEWFMVARADVFKRWGVTAESIGENRTPISDVRFVNPEGRHGGQGSTMAHNEIIDIIDSSSSVLEYVTRLQKWASSRLPEGINSLPPKMRSTMPKEP